MYETDGLTVAFGTAPPTFFESDKSRSTKKPKDFH
jgi:hypothetical protein